MKDGNYSFWKAMNSSPLFKSFIAESQSFLEDPARKERREEDWYAQLCEPSSTQEQQTEARTALLYLNKKQLLRFLKKFDKPMDESLYEDLMVEGVIVLWETIDRWDPERGSFASAASWNLKKLNRKYYKLIGWNRSQTGIQMDASVRSYDERCLQKEGKVRPADEAAEDLHLSSTGIERARLRNKGGAGKVDSYENIEEAFPQYFRTEESFLKNLLDEEFVQEAEQALSSEPLALLIFQTFLETDGDKICYLDLQKRVSQKLGASVSYVQVYRKTLKMLEILCRENIVDSMSLKRAGYFDRKMIACAPQR